MTKALHLVNILGRALEFIKDSEFLDVSTTIDFYNLFLSMLTSE